MTPPDKKLSKEDALKAMAETAIAEKENPPEKTKLVLKKKSKLVRKSTPDGGKQDKASSIENAVDAHLPLAEQSGLVLQRLCEVPHEEFVLFGGLPHRIVKRNKKYKVELHTRESLRGHVARHVTFEKYLKSMEQWMPTDPSDRLIDDLLSLSKYPKGIPVLESIKNTPLLTGKGKLIATSGLHPKERVYLDIDPALEGMELPEEITEEDIANALDIITDPFVDFPIADEDSSANLIGLLFAMVFRECFDGVTPLFVIDANRASTGKGMLCSVLSMIAYGHEAQFGSGSMNSEEIRKRLFALVMKGARFHVLDNVEQIVWSSELAAFLTSPIWEDRPLHTSETYSFPNQMVIAITGNHVRVGGDMARRTVLVHLHNEHERPEERGDFKYDPLLAHVRQERPNILRAMYTIVAAWHRNGRVVPKRTPRMGSFQEWANFSAGILDTLGGFGGLLGNWNEMRNRDSDTDELIRMTCKAREQFGNQEFTGRDLLGSLDPDDIPSRINRGNNASSVSRSLRMGRLLVCISDRTLGNEGLCIRNLGKKDNTNYFCIETRAERTGRIELAKKKRDEAEAEAKDTETEAVAEVKAKPKVKSKTKTKSKIKVKE